MNKFLLSSMLTLSFSLPITVTENPDLYFSEYIEGSSYNKALEIYNDTATTLDLSSYNADEPRALDYNEELKTANQLSELYSADVYRASDHDPVVIEFN